jgi:hypothetical protein
MAGLLLLAAWAMLALGGIMILIAAFRVGILWGLAVLFLPGIVHLIFIIVYWKEAKPGVFVQLAAIPVVLLAMVLKH